MTKFVITVRSVQSGSFGGGLGKIRYLAVPDGASPAPGHEIALRAWIAAIMATFPASGASRASGDALFLVHGFNVTSDDADAWSVGVAAGLAAQGYKPTIVNFDWPSAGVPYAYLPDLDVAANTAVLLVNGAVKPLLKAQTDDCRVRVNALAHSMGAFLLRKALGHADDGILTGTDWTFGQLALAAGDVEASGFTAGDNDTEAMLGHAYRLTNYFNRYDEVLAISNAKRAGVADRVGRIGLPADAPPSTVNVDCSARYEAIPAKPGPLDPNGVGFSHDWYFTDDHFFRDLAQTLSGAVDRKVVAGRTLDDAGNLSLAV